MVQDFSEICLSGYKYINTILTWQARAMHFFWLTIRAISKEASITPKETRI